MIKVMLVDDQDLIREGIKMILSLCEEIEVVDEAANGKEAFEKVKKNKDIDVILMDIKMPEMNGVEATKKIKELENSPKVVILTTFKDDEYLFEALKNGADGYILKDVKSDEIVEAIKTVYSGNMLLRSEMAEKILKFINGINKEEKKKEVSISGPYESLTQREVEIAVLISEGKSNKEISETLYITEGTVKNHLTRILAKLQLRDRTQLALYVNKHTN
ncbi:response regulator [Geotoga petraea]|jgi:DNA-binding NarL/FixJ family response regulator|uniref:DNA-binding response regulator, NarL/FixJ family, contains REC and HTH domains n=1 Tax=Geotoga petraea TaxID=28234 RepID=A0A1G6PZP3_9BACT|nr:response regulator transcription factor [Geotoga petraea]TGG86831.1 response regulator transcription factor [Geotoga petraea]SDC85006.1 DNA-binding response regulator, NarL/FixJ family, contains REC and HTH domains [Geotoga petraea]